MLLLSTHADHSLLRGSHAVVQTLHASVSGFRHPAITALPQRQTGTQGAMRLFLAVRIAVSPVIMDSLLAISVSLSQPRSEDIK